MLRIACLAGIVEFEPGAEGLIWTGHGLGELVDQTRGILSGTRPNSRAKIAATLKWLLRRGSLRSESNRFRTVSHQSKARPENRWAITHLLQVVEFRVAKSKCSFFSIRQMCVEILRKRYPNRILLGGGA